MKEKPTGPWGPEEGHSATGTGIHGSQGNSGTTGSWKNHHQWDPDQSNQNFCGWGQALIVLEALQRALM